jgi:hypothetical protein
MSVQSSAIAAAPLGEFNGRRTVRVTGVPSPRCFHTGGVPALATSTGTDTTPVATTEYIAEVSVHYPTVVNGIALFNGSVASGNVTVALRDALGNIIAKSASTAQSGTTAYQNIPFSTSYINDNGQTITESAAARIDAGTYYVSVQIDNTTGRLVTFPVGAFGAGSVTSGTYGTFLNPGVVPVTFTATKGPLASLY